MFKSRKIAESKVKEQALAQDQPTQDFLQLWQAMKAETQDKIRLGKLELKVDKAWQALTQDQKDATWMICCPEHRKVKEVFSAHAVNLRDMKGN